MQCVFGFAAAFGCRRPAKSRSVQTNFVYKNGCPLVSPLNTLKTSLNGETQSLSRITLEKHRQKCKFLSPPSEGRRRQKFAFWRYKTTKT